MLSGVQVLTESLINESLIKAEFFRILAILLQDMIDHAFAALAELLVYIFFDLLC